MRVGPSHDGLRTKSSRSSSATSSFTLTFLSTDFKDLATWLKENEHKTAGGMFGRLTSG